MTDETDAKTTGNGQNPGLNPDLKSRTNTSRDTENPSRPPADSASVQREEGRGWPAIWLIVTVVCVAVAAYLIFW